MRASRIFHIYGFFFKKKQVIFRIFMLYLVKRLNILETREKKENKKKASH